MARVIFEPTTFRLHGKTTTTTPPLPSSLCWGICTNACLIHNIQIPTKLRLIFYTCSTVKLLASLVAEAFHFSNWIVSTVIHAPSKFILSKHHSLVSFILVHRPMSVQCSLNYNQTDAAHGCMNREPNTSLMLTKAMHSSRCQTPSTGVLGF